MLCLYLGWLDSVWSGVPLLHRFIFLLRILTEVSSGKNPGVRILMGMIRLCFCGTDLVLVVSLILLVSFLLIRLCTRLETLVSNAFNVTVRSSCKGLLLLLRARLDAYIMPMMANTTNPLTMLE